MENSGKDNLSILVSSCDKYEDLWEPFFELLRLNWQDCKYPIYLNTETKDFHKKIGKYNVQVINSPKGKESESWSARLKRCLKTIPTDFVLFSLEDFFIMSTVDSQRIEKVLSWMEKDKSIVNVCFYPMYDSYTTESMLYPGFALRKKDCNYLVQCQLGIWRKGFLLKLLRSYEDAWTFESSGTKRAEKLPGDWYCQVVGKPMCFSYFLSPQHGYGVYNGKWLWNDKPLFEKFGINVDFSRRETIDSREALEEFWNSQKHKSDEIVGGEAAYHNSLRYKIKSFLPEKIVELIIRIKKRNRYLR